MEHLRATVYLLAVGCIVMPSCLWLVLSGAGPPHSRSGAPRLSIVLCGDLATDASRLKQMIDHTGYLLRMAQGGAVLLRQRALEVVFVSWDLGDEHISTEDWSARLSTAEIAVHVSSVTHAEHLEYMRSLGPDGASVGYFEFECKNVALRRAQGDYLLLTNVDILFSPCLIDGIVQAVQSLPAPSNIVWRAYRSDLHAALPDLVDDMQVLTATLASANQTLHTRTDSGRLEDEYFLLESDLIDEACGDFVLASRSAWDRTKVASTGRYFVALPYTWHMDSLQMRRFRDVGVSQSIFYCPLYHRWHPKRNQAGKPRPAIPLAFLDEWSAHLN